MIAIPRFVYSLPIEKVHKRFTHHRFQPCERIVQTLPLEHSLTQMSLEEIDKKQRLQRFKIIV